MLECEGYKMFRGTAVITPKTVAVAPFLVCGVWLYKPDTGCWYVKGQSFPAGIVSHIREEENA